MPNHANSMLHCARAGQGGFVRDLVLNGATYSKYYTLQYAYSII